MRIIKGDDIHIGESWQDFFKFGVEGGFFQLVTFILKAAIVIVIFQVVGWSILFSVMEVTLKDFQPICSAVLSQKP